MNPATFDIPSWATYPAAYAFYLGFCMAIVVRLVRVGLRWFSSVGGPDHGPVD
jgi:hypothetical protein